MSKMFTRKRMLFSLLTILAAVIAGLLGVRMVNADPGNGNNNGNGDLGGHGSVERVWLKGDLGNDPNAVIQNYYNQRGISHSWNPNESWKPGDSYNKALQDCQRNSGSRGCSNPKIVAMGWVAFNSGGHRYLFSAANLGNSWADYGNIGQQITQGNVNVNSGKVFPSGTSIDSMAMQDGGHVIGVIVLPDWAYNPVGWRQNWSDHAREDVKSLGHDATEQIPECAVAYNITANGYDGYVKGMSSTTKTYLTPFGDLKNAIAKGDDQWNPWQWKNNSRQPADNPVPNGHMRAENYPEYKTDPDEATRKANDTIRTLASTACSYTHKMEINYSLDKDGGQPGKDLNQQFKRGGQYKITKQAKMGSITMKRLDLVYQKRGITWHQWEGWTQCENGTPGCEHVGESRPADPQGMELDSFGSGKWGYYVNATPWTGASQGEARASVRNGANIDGRPLGRVFNTDDRQIGQGRPSPVNWFGNGEDQFNFGNSTGYIPGTHFHAVPDQYQSYTAVAMQDFIHTNCNQKDFTNLASWVREKGILDESSVQNTRNNGYMNTIVMTGTPAKQKIDKRALEALGGWDAVAPGSNKPAGFDVNWAKATGSDAGDIDPIYTKECPYDCVADKNVVKTNVRDSDANDDNKSNFSYGIKAWANDSKDDDTPDAVKNNKSTNTADMIFFRNNEWNYLKTDKWVPRSADGITYSGSPATTTTIVRDTNGTPWVSSDGKNLLTEMQASTDGGSNYKRIFSTDDVSKANIYSESDVLSQWSNGTDKSSTEAFNAGASYKLVGDATDFRIKSAWASDEGHPLKFNVKWEYQTNNQVPVLDQWEIDGDGTATGNNVTIKLRNEQQKVDGKCDSQFHNKDQAYLDHQQNTQQWTGHGVKDVPDVKYYENDPLKGWFSVTFVRATGE